MNDDGRPILMLGVLAIALIIALVVSLFFGASRPEWRDKEKLIIQYNGNFYQCVPMKLVPDEEKRLKQ